MIESFVILLTTSKAKGFSQTTMESIWVYKTKKYNFARKHKFPFKFLDTKNSKLWVFKNYFSALRY